MLDQRSFMVQIASQSLSRSLVSRETTNEQSIEIAVIRLRFKA